MEYANLLQAFLSQSSDETLINADTSDANHQRKVSTLKTRNRLLAIPVSMIVMAVGLLLGAAPAQAYQHLCGPLGSTPSFGCVAFSGYSGQSTWGYPGDANGHNCTNYAAYRLSQNGAPNPGNFGDAKDWDNSAAAKGFTVDHNPVVGSIAQWEANAGIALGFGHVAYVETVTSTYIDVTEDNYGGTSSKVRYTKGQSDWPSHFIHVKDINPTPPPQPLPLVASSRNADGRIEFFAVGLDGKIYGRAQAVANGSFNPSWYTLPGTAKDVAAINNADGRIEVFHVDPDGTVYGRAQTTVNGAFGSPYAIGSDAKAVAVARNADGRIEVFVITTSNQVQAKAQSAPNGSFNPSWYTIPGGATDITATSNADGRIELIYIGTDGAIYAHAQLAPNGQFGGEYTLGGNVTALTAARNADGRIEIFAIGTDSKIYGRAQAALNGSFNPSWYTIPGGASNVFSAVNADGRIELLYTGGDTAIWGRGQLAPNGQFGGEYTLGGSFK